MYLKPDTNTYTDSWWKNIKTYATFDGEYCMIMLQEHTGGNTGVIGFVRSVQWLSNHNHKYRVVFRYKKSNLKELYHSNDLNASNTKYFEYKQVIEWKSRH